jgi:hypothetical protein
MIGSFQLAGYPAKSGDSFVVRYTGDYLGFYLVRILPLIVLFSLLAGLYLEERSRLLIFSRGNVSHKPFSVVEFGFLMALVAGGVLDLKLTLERVRAGAIALSVSHEGITGPIFHRTRLLAWDEIVDVAVDGKFLVIRREPRSVFQKLFAGRGIGDINIPAHQLDHDIQDILAAARRFAPPG